MEPGGVEPAGQNEAEPAEPPTEVRATPSLATAQYQVAPPPPAQPSPRPSPPIGRLIIGGLLLAAGILWLLGALDVVNVPVQSILPIALIAVGLALVAGARSGRHSGLLVLGVVLTVVLALLSSFDIRLQGGVGERNEHPLARGELKRNYRLAVGRLTIDLTDLNLPETTTEVHARVGIGQLTVRVPRGLPVIVRGEAGAGQLVLLGHDESGINQELTVSTKPFPSGQPRLRLFLSVGLGQIEVTR
jgi:Cell wall-active antibiotics response LiaF, C-terminal